MIEMPMDAAQVARYQAYKTKPRLTLTVTLNLGAGQDALDLARNAMDRSVDRGVTKASVRRGELKSPIFNRTLGHVALLTMEGPADKVAEMVLAIQAVFEKYATGK